MPFLIESKVVFLQYFDLQYFIILKIVSDGCKNVDQTNAILYLKDIMFVFFMTSLSDFYIIFDD